VAEALENLEHDAAELDGDEVGTDVERCEVAASAQLHNLTVATYRGHT
jgi:hypothetical protein